MSEENKSGIRNTIAKILFIIGVIIILILLIFAIVRFVPVIFGGLANVGTSITETIKGKDKAIDVTSNNSDIKDGDIFAISWNYDTNKTGTYSLSYDCTDTAEFDIQQGNVIKRMICNTPYEVEDNRVELLARYDEDNSFEDVTFKVSFTEDEETVPSISGKTIVTVKKDSSTDTSAVNGSTNGDLSSATITSEPVETTKSTSNTSNSSPSYTYTYSYPTVTGPADLAISNVVSIPNRSTVQFTVSNIGGRSSGIWQFSYTSPSSPRETLSSGGQVSLAPGQSIRYTLSFSEQDDDEEGIAIIVDPFDTINESNESNNSTAVTITGIGTGGSNNGGGYNRNDDANFEIIDLEVGYISGGRFREDDTLDEGDDAAIRFVVKNTGGEETDDFRFEIEDTPYSESGNDFRSRTYNSLRPGESREFILEFENIDEGNYDIEVFVDSDDDTDEESESDNRESVDLRVRN